jgi:hypothetical protein
MLQKGTHGNRYLRHTVTLPRLRDITLERPPRGYRAFRQRRKNCRRT